MEMPLGARGLGSPGVGATDGVGAFEEQQVLLNIDSSLLSLEWVLFFFLLFKEFLLKQEFYNPNYVSLLSHQLLHRTELTSQAIPQ